MGGFNWDILNSEVLRSPTLPGFTYCLLLFSGSPREMGLVDPHYVITTSYNSGVLSMRMILDRISEAEIEWVAQRKGRPVDIKEYFSQEVLKTGPQSYHPALKAGEGMHIKC